MVQVTVDIDMSELVKDLSPEKGREVTSKTLNYATQEMVRQLMRNSPVDHGLLKSWFVESITDTEAHIKSPAKYAKYVNDGTGPHMIYPKGQGRYHAGRQLTKGSALWWPGAEHPVRRVRHPGIRGQHFVEKSIETVEAKRNEFMMKALEEVLG